MLKQLEVINFQGHKYSLLSFGDGLNVITGRTHSGKSSLVRALKWVLQNRPRGDGFRRDGAKNSDPVTVSISFEDGKFVIREKNPNKDINLYKTSEVDDPLKALRTDLPDEVIAVTNMGPENLLSQGDRYFMLEKTPGQVATSLNKVLGLQVIDDKKAKIKRIIQKYSSEEKVISAQISDTEKMLEEPEYAIVESLAEQVKEINKKMEEYRALDTEVLKVKNISSNIESENQIILEASKLIKREGDTKYVSGLLVIYHELESNITSVIDKSASIESWQAEMKEAERIMANEDAASNIKSKLAEAIDLRFKIDKIKSLYTDIKKAETIMQDALQEEKTAKNRKTELESRLNYCSKCGAEKKYWRIERTL